MSINELARLYPKDLLVDPIKWTSLHLNVLGCSFTRPCVAMPTSEANHAKHCSCKKIINRFLTYYEKYHFREKYIVQLLTADQILESSFVSSWSVNMKSAKHALYRKDLKLYLNRKFAAQLTCNTLYVRNEDVASTVLEQPVAAYIDRDHLKAMRAKRFSSSPGNHNERLRRIQPEEPSHDPYIVALLIALAQKTRVSTKNVNSKEAVITSQVLCSIKLQPNCEPTSDALYLYRADIPLSLLHGLDFTDQSPEKSPVLVQVISIPVKPTKSLHNRLLTAILSPNLPRG